MSTCQSIDESMLNTETTDGSQLVLTDVLHYLDFNFDLLWYSVKILTPSSDYV